jgi:lipopolysaccharide/colanic/teichoic acid biosynthesis glycosyltransferase
VGGWGLGHPAGRSWPVRERAPTVRERSRRQNLSRNPARAAHPQLATVRPKTSAESPRAAHLEEMRARLLQKRLMDLALVLITLPLWGLLLGLLALIVLLLDGRPVFFPQPRLGRGGRRFRILKLRSMTTEADPRSRKPTGLGRHLRQHGLDELPQLINVLTGDMSLVGPRPLTPDDLQRLAVLHPEFARRLDLPPGLTGLAQVCSAQGAALTAALEVHYAQQQTAGLDLAILVRTAWINVVGKRRGRRPLPPGLA